MTESREWRKSSRSSTNTNCVEVANGLDAVRDSKNPDGPVLEFDQARLGAFLAGACQGRFDN